MRFKGLDLNLLVSLDVLLDECSVSRAARRLHLSQPATSAALSRLRDFFDDELLVLHGKKMLRTPFAEVLVPDLKITLAKVDALITTPADFDPASARRSFRIMASDYVVGVLVGPAMARLQSCAPGISLDFILPSDRTLAEFERGEIDLVLTPEPYLSRTHPSEVLFEERHVVVGWAGNEALREPLTEAAFLALEFVAVRVGSGERQTFAEKFLDSCLPQRQVDVFAPSFMLVPWLLRGTSRISVMHERLADMFCETLPLSVQPLPIDMPPMREMIQYHSAREGDPGIAWLRSFLRQAAANTLA